MYIGGVCSAFVNKRGHARDSGRSTTVVTLTPGLKA